MLNPLNWLRKIGPTGRKATELYGSIVTQARLPAFYRELGVPDTTNGRYEMLILHISCVLNALQQSSSTGGRMARALTEAFIADMDDTMRELGVGDLSVPKKVKKTAAGLRERTIAYRGADNDNDHLAKKIAEYFEMSPDSPTVRALVCIPYQSRPVIGAGSSQGCAERRKSLFSGGSGDATDEHGIAGWDIQFTDVSNDAGLDT